MKRKMPIALVLVILVVSVFSTGVYADTNGPYDFPIRPGSDEWVSLNTHDEMIEVCQIPKDILESMSTDDLITTILDYPLSTDIYAFNSIQEGFDCMSSNFNGFEELSTRDDAASRLLYRYNDTQILSPNSKSSGLQPVFDVTLLEAMLSDDAYNSKLTIGEKEVFENSVAEKYEQRMENSGTYAMSLSPFYEALALKQSDDIALLDSTVYVKTPNGTNVAVTVKSSEMSQSAINDVNNHYDSRYPKAVRISSASMKYNCHTYAWHSTNNRTYWMADPSPYWEDGSYSKFELNAQTGDRAFYSYANHSSIVTDQSTYTHTSKWGTAGIYRHRPDYCPYPSGNVKYHRR